MDQNLDILLNSKTKKELIQMYKNLLEDKNNKYYKLAMHDQLTSVYNRRGLLTYFDELMNNKQLNNKTLLFVDINNFKTLNDTYGHDFGDYVLQYFAKWLQDTLPVAAIGRYGGDEFVVILDTEVNNVASIGNNLKISYEKIEITISFSFGQANYLKDYTLSDWIREADKKMYLHKKYNKII